MRIDSAIRGRSHIAAAGEREHGERQASGGSDRRMRGRVTGPATILRAAALLGCGLWLVQQSIPTAAAAPLPKEECDALKSEQGRLVAAGVRAEMSRGAAWAKTNLAPERMTSIARLIEVDEQILFRCGAAQAAAAAAAAAAEQAAAEQAKANAAAGQPPAGAPAAAPKPRKPIPAEKSKDKAAEPSQAAGASDAAAKPAQPQPPRKRAAAKPKSDDAYVPPEGAPQSVLKPPAEAGGTPAKVE